MNDLCYLPAVEALARFHELSLSPVELMEAVIARAEAVEPTINAFTYTHFDQALDAARDSEQRYAQNRPVGPLDGLPVAVKDESEIAGRPTSSGSLLLENYVADRTSVLNKRLLDAGAIVHARTATPEFCCAAFTWSRLWGVTRNPWNPDMTPGGSSGGSAASLAAGTCILATGSDIGGSIRIPASCCGVVGFKPPYGRNPEDPPFNLDFFCHNGPLARTVADTVLFQNVMSGPSSCDIVSLPRLELPREYSDITGWSVAYSPDLGAFQVDPDVVANTESALDVFTDLGAKVTEVKLNWGAEVLDACMTYLEHIFGGYIAGIASGSEDRMTTYCRDFARRAQSSTARDYVEALEVIARMYHSLGPILDQHQILICPTNALPAVSADFDQSRQDLEINGVPVRPDLGWVMTTPFNAMSRCPVLSVPSGLASNGVPTGIQIVGRPYRDKDVFQAAIKYERAVGGWLTQGNRPML